MAHTIHTPSIHVGNGNAQSGNITNSFNNNIYKSDEDAKIICWLSPLEPNKRHQDVRTERYDGVGDWLLEEREFREWRNNEGGGDKAVLFCSGNPGVGKTYLSSLVIDSLCDQAKKEDIAVAGLYCDYLSQREQTITNMMGAILGQLVGRGDIPKYLHEAFHEAKKEFGGRGPRLPDLMEMLRIAIASLPRVFICIDALDECIPKYLPELLGSLRDIAQESPGTRIFLTGRPHVRDDVLRYFTKAVAIPVSPNVDDIKNYVEMRLDRDDVPNAMNDALRADVIRIILEKISDVFLLVSLKIESILGEVTIRQRRKKLENMTQGNGLGDAYTATLTRLKAQKGNKSALGLNVLMWVLYSERPLRAKELRHALGVEMGSADLDPDNIPELQTLISSSLGLVTLEASSSTIRLVHFTLQEHLLSDPTLFHSPHATIAEVCLTYLNFGSVQNLSPTLGFAPPETPLLEYASCYWGNHTRRGMSEKVKRLALRLLDGFDKHISAQLMLLNYPRYTYSFPYFRGSEGPRGFTGLHGVSFLGLGDVVSAVMEMKEWDVNATDCTGSTALMWAAGRGHEEVVKALLACEDINPDTADTTYGQTPLLWAAQHGHEGVVKILLAREDVNPDRADAEYGRTPLWWAAQNGYEGVVKMLLAREDVTPDTADTKYGQTPLSWAAQNGHEVVVKMLLAREDVNPDGADAEYGRTPLWWAAKNGYEGVVKMLLAREDVNPDTADTKYGRTPLTWAAQNGHEGVVKMLLAREDVNPDRADTTYGQTPLSWAAENGHEGVVRVLLARGDVNPDTADIKYGRTPLWWAAQNGHEGVVKMLLAREDVDPATADTLYGRTPLSWAAENGHEGVVNVLLAREDVNPDTIDTEYGLTPLCWAARRGCVGVVKMLLECEDVDPNMADTEYGLTPLCWAARRGCVGVVKMLLAREDVNPNMADIRYGQTPLSWAAENGHEGVVTLLLECEDVNSNTADIIYDRTPLEWAAMSGHDRVAKLLSKRKDVCPPHATTGIKRHCRGLSPENITELSRFY